MGVELPMNIADEEYRIRKVTLVKLHLLIGN